MENVERPIKDIKYPEETKREYCKRIFNLYIGDRKHYQPSSDKKA